MRRVSTSKAVWCKMSLTCVVCIDWVCTTEIVTRQITPREYYIAQRPNFERNTTYSPSEKRDFLQRELLPLTVFCHERAGQSCFAASHLWSRWCLRDGGKNMYGCKCRRGNNLGAGTRMIYMYLLLLLTLAFLCLDWALKHDYLFCFCVFAFKVVV